MTDHASSGTLRRNKVEPYRVPPIEDDVEEPPDLRFVEQRPRFGAADAQQFAVVVGEIAVARDDLLSSEDHHLSVQRAVYVSLLVPEVIRVVRRQPVLNLLDSRTRYHVVPVRATEAHGLRKPSQRVVDAVGELADGKRLVAEPCVLEVVGREVVVAVQPAAHAAQHLGVLAGRSNEVRHCAHVEFLVDAQLLGIVVDSLVQALAPEPRSSFDDGDGVVLLVQDVRSVLKNLPVVLLVLRLDEVDALLVLLVHAVKFIIIASVRIIAHLN